MLNLFDVTIGSGALAGSGATAYITFATCRSPDCETGHHCSSVADAVDSGCLGVRAESCPYAAFLSIDYLALSSILS